MAALRKHRAGKVFREMASGRNFAAYSISSTPSTVMMVTRLDRQRAAPTDMLNMLAAITAWTDGT